MHESKFKLLLLRPNDQLFRWDYDLTTKQLAFTQHSTPPLVKPEGLLCNDSIKLSAIVFSRKVLYLCCPQIFFFFWFLPIFTQVIGNVYSVPHDVNFCNGEL